MFTLLSMMANDTNNALVGIIPMGLIMDFVCVLLLIIHS